MDLMTAVFSQIASCNEILFCLFELNVLSKDWKWPVVKSAISEFHICRLIVSCAFFLLTDALSVCRTPQDTLRRARYWLNYNIKMYLKVIG
jgi:hypothetical protein